VKVYSGYFKGKYKNEGIHSPQGPEVARYKYFSIQTDLAAA
jgi:hypothetical protein